MAKDETRLKVAVLVVTNEQGERKVSFRVANGDDTMAFALMMKGDSAVRLAAALHAAGKNAESNLVVAGSVPGMGQA